MPERRIVSLRDTPTLDSGSLSKRMIVVRKPTVMNAGGAEWTAQIWTGHRQGEASGKGMAPIADSIATLFPTIFPTDRAIRNRTSAAKRAVDAPNFQ